MWHKFLPVCPRLRVPIPADPRRPLMRCYVCVCVCEATLLHTRARAHTRTRVFDTLRHSNIIDDSPRTFAERLIKIWCT